LSWFTPAHGEFVPAFDMSKNTVATCGANLMLPSAYPGEAW